MVAICIDRCWVVTCDDKMIWFNLCQKIAHLCPNLLLKHREISVGENATLAIFNLFSM